MFLLCHTLYELREIKVIIIIIMIITHTLVSPTPTTIEGYLLEFESSMSVSFVSEYSRYKSWLRVISHSRDPIHGSIFG